jgi:thiosulfate/3-mercaptopyruvate sulfurtransferase
MFSKITKAIVSVDWLHSNLGNENLIILDCTIPKATSQKDSSKTDDKRQIKDAIFFDIKNVFSHKQSTFPNTVLSSIDFEIRARDIGINNDSIIVVYDRLGIYSSPRVWWMFQLMGFKNIAVLDGGFPAWKSKQYPTEKLQNHPSNKGNFTSSYQKNKIKHTNDVFLAIKDETILIADARSKGRFYATELEPRIEVKGGHIPNSVSMPYSEIVENGMLKSEEDLKIFFNIINPKKKDFIFSCGTGITASILALGAEVSGVKNHAVYDGSWTEWGSTVGLPIEK